MPKSMYILMLATTYFIQNCCSLGFLGQSRAIKLSTIPSNFCKQSQIKCIGRRALAISVTASLVVSTMVTSPVEVGAYSVSGISDEGLKTLRKQEDGARAYLTKSGLDDDRRVIPLVPGTPSYDNGLKIMKRFNQSMEAYERGSYEIVRVNNSASDIEQLLEEVRKSQPEANSGNALFNEIQQMIPQQYRRKIVTNLSIIIHQSM